MAPTEEFVRSRYMFARGAIRQQCATGSRNGTTSANISIGSEKKKYAYA